MKPTAGLVSKEGTVVLSAAQDTAGPVARTVTDAAIVLSVIQGADPHGSAPAGAARYAVRDY